MEKLGIFQQKVLAAIPYEPVTLDFIASQVTTFKKTSQDRTGHFNHAQFSKAISQLGEKGFITVENRGTTACTVKRNLIEK